MLRTPQITASLALALTLSVGLGACGSESDSPDAQPAQTFDAAIPGIDAATPGIDAALPGPDAGGSKDPDAQVTEVDTNNSATLSGTVVEGFGTLERKLLPIEVELGTKGLEVGDGYALGSGNYVYYLFDVANTGTSDVCGVAFDSVTYLDGNGTQLGEPGYSVVAGAVRDIGDAFTSTCLAPGQHGWILDINNTTGFDNVASVRVSVTAFDLQPTLPGARVKPVSYDLADGLIAVNVENQGTVAANLGLSSSIAFDEAGLPLAWSFFSESGLDLATGAATTLTDYPIFGGDMHSMQVNISFSDSVAFAAAAAASPALARIQVANAGLRQRAAAARAARR
jgi:hypothetical protein